MVVGLMRRVNHFVILPLFLQTFDACFLRHHFQFLSSNNNNNSNNKNSRSYQNDNQNRNDSTNCQIYCYGELLHTVQMSHLFEDSKTFVDMKMKFPAEQIIENFQSFMKRSNRKPSKNDIQTFVESHFDEVGKEFKPWVPDDWTNSPDFLNRINDPDLKQWAVDLNNIWKELGRKMTDDVHKNPQLYSIVPIVNPVIVPGGRFREFYYWDSYWIVRGLLYSEMKKTVRGMLENFIAMVKHFSFVPNGGRIYYAKRSQPPLLAGMIKSYVDFTNDMKFGVQALDVLEHEFEYWMNNRTVQVNGHNVCIYGDTSSGPRPESYREDVLSAEIFPNDEQKEIYYSELRAAAESGMDFSSRWYINSTGGNGGDLTNLKTRSIVPVELQAILFWNAKIISELHSKAGNKEKHNEYLSKANKILEAIEAVHWNEEVGVWLDYDVMNKKSRNYFVPTNLSPLWTSAYKSQHKHKISKSIMGYIKQLELDKYPGGVPNTLTNTGEQWDYPNVWPPMQYILIEGLQNLGTSESRALAKCWLDRWIKSNFAAYSESRVMFEKYNAEEFGRRGGGGEYEIQKGFGWTNGVIIEFLSKYGDELTLNNSSNCSNDCTKD